MGIRPTPVRTRACARPFAALACSALAFALSAAPAVAQNRSGGPADPLFDHVPGEVLVGFLPDATPAAIGLAADEVGAVELARFPRIGVHHWKLAHGITVEQALRILGRSAHRDAIEFVEPNHLYYPTQIPNDPRRGEQDSLHNLGQNGGTADADIDALEAWQVQTGSASIVVGVVDSGVNYNHADLAANIWTNPGEIPGNGIDDDGNGFVDDVRGWDFANNDNDPMDDLGHGTHVAGTIGAVGNNGVGVTGVAWNVRLMPLKFISSAGYGTASAAIGAINYAASFTSGGSKVVRITSNSWIGIKTKSLERAITDSGALFVAAAGNSGSSTKEYPAAYTFNNILSVAATDKSDGLASFSNFGIDWVDLAAPGVDVLSTTADGGYGLMGGTSMSAPHVAGAAALVMAQFAGISVLDTKAQLLATVDALPSLSGKMVTGGRLNVRRAVNASELPPDSIAPDTVADLVVASVTETSVTLNWTAPGDDGGSGAGYLYDARYSTQPITDANWSSATRVSAEPAPAVGGSLETFTLDGLQPSTTYHFAVRTLDEVGNSSATSNSAPGTTDDNGWFISSPEGAWGAFTTHAYDPSGRPALAYTTAPSIDGLPNGIDYALFDGSTWTIEQVSPLTYQGSSLGFASDGTPTISFGVSSLRVHERVGGTWVSTVVDPTDAAIFQTSLAFRGTRASVAYRYGTKQRTLKLATRNGNYGTAWTTEVVDSNAAARFTGLGFDGAGNPVIAYSDDRNRDGSFDAVKVARWNGSSWNVSFLESGVEGYGRYLSMAVDPTTGNPAVAHMGTGQIRFWRWNGSSWILELPDSATNCGPTGLAYGADGTCWLSYTLYGEGLKIARRDAVTGTWTFEIAEPGEGVRGLSQLRVDAAGLPSLGYSGKLAHKMP